MKYGNHTPTKYQSRQGYSLNEWVDIDFTKENLKRNGFAPKRNWNEIIGVKLTHFMDDYCIGVSGSLDSITIPYVLLPKKS